MRRDMSEVGDINTHILQREQRHEQNMSMMGPTTIPTQFRTAAIRKIMRYAEHIP